MRSAHPICRSNCRSAIFAFGSGGMRFGCHRFSPLRLHSGLVSGGLATIVTCCTCLVVNLSVSAVSPGNKARLFHTTRGMIATTRSLGRGK